MSFLLARWKILAVVVLVGTAYGAGRVHQSWKEGDARQEATAEQIEADQRALKAWGRAVGGFTDRLVRFLDTASRPDPVRRVKDVPNRGDCPHTAVSAELRNDNARALNAARARDRRAFGSDEAVSAAPRGRRAGPEP